MSEWQLKRGDALFTAKSAAELQEWARAGRIYAGDLIFHPVLERWMYAKETEELRGFTLLPGGGPDPTAATSPKRSSTTPWVVVVGIVAISGFVINFLTSVSTETAVAPAATQVQPPPTSQPAAAASRQEPTPAVDRDDAMRSLVTGLSPLTESYEIIGPASIRLQLNPDAWDALTGDQQQRLMDELASRQIVRDVHATIHVRVRHTEVGKIGPGWGGEYKFRPSED